MEGLFFIGCTIVAAAAAGAVAVKAIGNGIKLNRLRKQMPASGADAGSEDLEKEIDQIVNKAK